MILFLLFLGVLLPVDAWGFIPHNYPAFYPHQIAHIFLAIATAVFIYYLYRNRLVEDRGWRHIAISGWFFILWNLYTFVGHIMELFVQPGVFQERDHFFRGVIRLEPLTTLYYIYKLDNLILVPVLYFFYSGVRRHLKRVEGTE